MEMNCSTSSLCDYFADLVDVVDPIFQSYGKRTSFCGIITTVKCFENTGLIDEILAENGSGRVLLIDAGGSRRKAVLEYNMIKKACDNLWEGIVCYGSVRDVELLSKMDIGIKAVAAIPVLGDGKTEGDVDLPVNFAGVTFLPEDFLYADLTGVIISPDELHMSDVVDR